MTNAELIKALRCGTMNENPDRRCNECNYYSCGACCFTIIMTDAADAIERLMAEVDRKDRAIQGLLTQIERKDKTIERTVSGGTE